MTEVDRQQIVFIANTIKHLRNTVEYCENELNNLAGLLEKIIKKEGGSS